MKRGIDFGTIIKILLLGLLIFVGIFVYLSCSGGTCLCQRIDKTLPDAAHAPYIVTTHTHIYYANNAVTNPDGTVTMSGWYDRIDDKWVYQPGPETLPKILKPVARRR